MRWELRYWRDEEKRIVLVSDGRFVDAPAAGVVFLQVFYPGVLPHGLPGREYSMTVRGCDWYYLDDLVGVVRWGGWNDDPAHGCAGWTLYPDGRTETEMNHGRPSWLPADSPVKGGVWIPQPWAFENGIGCEVPPWQSFSWPHGHPCGAGDDYRGCC